MHNQSKLERYFESSIWKLRWTTLIAVIFSALTSIVMFYVAVVDTYYVLHELMGYAFVTDMFDRQYIRAEAVGHVVQIIDAFLLAIVLLIFSYGIYELYISRIDHVQDAESAEHLLQTTNLDHLKSRIGKVILMILIVKFFEISLSMGYNDVKELSVFAVAISLIALSFFLAEKAARTTGHLKTRKRDFEELRNKLIDDDQ